MVAKIEKTPHLNMYKIPIAQSIKENLEFVILAHKFNREKLERKLSVYYCADNGSLCIPIWKIEGIVILKRMINESDESALDR